MTQKIERLGSLPFGGERMAMHAQASALAQMINLLVNSGEARQSVGLQPLPPEHRRYLAQLEPALNGLFTALSDPDQKIGKPNGEIEVHLPEALFPSAPNMPDRLRRGSMRATLAQNNSGNLLKLHFTDSEGPHKGANSLVTLNTYPDQTNNALVMQLEYTDTVLNIRASYRNNTQAHISSADFLSA